MVPPHTTSHTELVRDLGRSRVGGTLCCNYTTDIWGRVLFNVKMPTCMLYFMAVKLFFCCCFLFVFFLGGGGGQGGGVVVVVVVFHFFFPFLSCSKDELS